MSGPVSISVEGVHKSFGKTRALGGVDLEFETGRMHGIIGPEGSGKTTLLRILLGLLSPSEGSVRYFEAGHPAAFKALRAAVAFPGIFTPVSFAGRFLVDGGLCNPVPIDAVRALGVDKVIGVFAIPEVDKRSGETFLPVPDGKQPRRKLRLPLFNAQGVEGLFLGPGLEQADVISQIFRRPECG